MKLLWAIPENILIEAESETKAFFHLFKLRAYDSSSLVPNTQETRAFFEAKTGIPASARKFITLTDENSFKLIETVKP